MSVKARPGLQCYDDEWVTIAWTNQHEECCDCGKRHVVSYRVVDGKLQFKGRALPKRRTRR